MRLLCLCASALLIGSSTPQKIVTEVQTIDRAVVVKKACLTAEEIPAKPERVMRQDADLRGLAAGAVAELRAWEAWGMRVETLLKSCL